MVKRYAGDAVLIVFLLFFSWWLMAKSFGYNAGASQFRVARHEVGDFGLHISLIRSFTWGQQTHAESPFYPGKPLVYHYAIDWLAGRLNRLGIRIDYALNGISAVSLTILLYGLYRLTMVLSHGSRIAGLVSIMFFVLPGNLSFIEFLRRAPKDLSFFSYLWHFPDYLHQGPFDGSMITIYSTLSPYLNQRHLIVGTTIGITVTWVIAGWLKANKRMHDGRWALMGVVIGAATRVHVVVAAATGIMVMVLLLGKRNRALLLFGGAAFLVALPHLVELFSIRTDAGVSQLWNPGYLAPRPLFVTSWAMFWVYNLGIFIVLIPLSFWVASGIGRRMMLGAGLLFILANTFQVSARIEHNHSLINVAIVIILPLAANLLVTWWHKRGVRWKFVATIAFMISIASGLINLIVVKNDYQFMVDDVGRSPFMQWVQTKTDPTSIFISKHALYDPVALTGRKNYLGLEYYVSVMGYDYWGRRKQIDTWLGNFNQHTVIEMKRQNIHYIAMSIDRKDFPYTVDEEKIKTLLPVSYSDETITVYEL